MTTGKSAGLILRFSIPLIFGNLFQQLYSIVDAVVVGRFIGVDALASIGCVSWLCWMINALFRDTANAFSIAASVRVGNRDLKGFRDVIGTAVIACAVLGIPLTVILRAAVPFILRVLNVQPNVISMTTDYLIVFIYMIPIGLVYNIAVSLLRAYGNSSITFVSMLVSTVVNIVLDLVFVLVFHWGVAGAAIATVFSQYVSGVGLLLYTFRAFPELRVRREQQQWRGDIVREIAGLSGLTCVQQSVMNLGILLVQGLVNSFGGAVMAAFAAAVKIDSFAYLPVQDFGNAFSTFIAQNYGARQDSRIRAGLNGAAAVSVGFGAALSALVWAFARPLMGLFVDAGEADVIAAGVRYLHIEGAFYYGIGVLFLLYGLYRALGRPGMSVVLTVISLGTRVALAYILSAGPLGVAGIWWAVPIGWALADAAGVGYYLLRKKQLLDAQ